MIYRTREGKEYPLTTTEERIIFQWLKQEYDIAQSWTTFQNRTAHHIIEHAKHQLNFAWQQHPLYQIQLDLIANCGIRNHELQGELSDMIIN